LVEARALSTSFLSPLPAAQEAPIEIEIEIENCFATQLSGLAVEAVGLGEFL
jgi:hypothetical protein